MPLYGTYIVSCGAGDDVGFLSLALLPWVQFSDQGSYFLSMVHSCLCYCNIRQPENSVDLLGKSNLI